MKHIEQFATGSQRMSRVAMVFLGAALAGLTLAVAPVGAVWKIGFAFVLGVAWPVARMVETIREAAKLSRYVNGTAGYRSARPTPREWWPAS